MNNGEKVIYAKWLAVELRKRGCRILEVRVNPHYPQYDCWVFKEDEHFNEMFEEIINK